MSEILLICNLISVVFYCRFICSNAIFTANSLCNLHVVWHLFFHLIMVEIHWQKRIHWYSQSRSPIKALMGYIIVLFSWFLSSLTIPPRPSLWPDFFLMKELCSMFPDKVWRTLSEKKALWLLLLCHFWFQGFGLLEHENKYKLLLKGRGLFHWCMPVQDCSLACMFPVMFVQTTLHLNPSLSVANSLCAFYFSPFSILFWHQSSAVVRYSHKYFFLVFCILSLSLPLS